MKKVLLATTALFLFTAATAFGANNEIKDTKHNLSQGGTSFSSANIKSDAGQICAYCHTPHNPKVRVPLWNRSNVEGTFGFYSSRQLSNTAMKGAQIDPNSISMMCMSCHAATGGSSTGTFIKGKSIDTTNQKLESTGTFTGSTFGLATGLGMDLTNDHPVGFSYAAAQTERGSGTNNGTPLRLVADATARGVTFYKVVGANPGTLGANSQDNDRIECASCHKTHDNSNRPFLRVNNTNSALCRACHLN